MFNNYVKRNKSFPEFRAEFIFEFTILLKLVILRFKILL